MTLTFNICSFQDLVRLHIIFSIIDLLFLSKKKKKKN